MTRDDLVQALHAIERQREGRIEVWRVIVTPDGVPTGRRIFGGSFQAPPGWEPPSLEDLLAHTKGRRTRSDEKKPIDIEAIDI